MINLILMELKKQFKRKSIIIIFILITILSFFTVYILNKNNIFEDINIYETIEVIKKEEYSGDYEKYIKETEIINNKIVNNVKIYNYYKANNIDMYLKTKNIFSESITVLLFLSIVIIILSASIIGDEYSKKSIKELLTKPYKRYKILTSKYLCMFIIIFSVTLYLAINFIIFVTIFTKINVFEICEIIIKNNKIVEMPYLLTYFKELFINSIPLYFISVFTIFLTSVFSNSKIISGIMTFITLMSTMIFQLFLKIDFTIVEYTFFPYLDFSIYKNIYDFYIINLNYGISLNLVNGILVLSIYSLIFYLISIYIFKRKDIVT